MGSVVGGGEAAVSQPAIRNEGAPVRVSEPVKRRLMELAADRGQGRGGAAAWAGGSAGDVPPGAPQVGAGVGGSPGEAPGPRQAGPGAARRPDWGRRVGWRRAGYPPERVEGICDAGTSRRVRGSHLAAQGESMTWHGLCPYCRERLFILTVQGSKRHVGGGPMVESARAVGPLPAAVLPETPPAV